MLFSKTSLESYELLEKYKFLTFDNNTEISFML